ncbi:MAG: KdsC family phosphatase [Terracidiphilus sp.]
MTITAQDRARRIRIILFDVDGVLTDGGLWLFPAAGGGTPSTQQQIAACEGRGGYAIAPGTMVESKGYSAHDGAGVWLARLGGLKCGIITRRISESVALRARDLHLEFVYMGQALKMRAVDEIIAQEGVTLEEIAYVGDDVIDLPVMRRCGLAVAVANARPQVKAAAHYITLNRGGQGAARDAIEFILAAKGLLEDCIETYIRDSEAGLPATDQEKGNDSHGGAR